MLSIKNHISKVPSQHQEFGDLSEWQELGLCPSRADGSVLLWNTLCKQRTSGWRVLSVGYQVGHCYDDRDGIAYVSPQVALTCHAGIITDSDRDIYIGGLWVMIPEEKSIRLPGVVFVPTGVLSCVYKLDTMCYNYSTREMDISMSLVEGDDDYLLIQ